MDGFNTAYKKVKVSPSFCFRIGTTKKQKMKKKKCPGKMSLKPAEKKYEQPKAVAYLMHKATRKN
jgi:hypothetical protein